MIKHYTFTFLSFFLFSIAASAQAVDDNVSTDQNTAVDIYVIFNDFTSGGLAQEPLQLNTFPNNGTAVVIDAGTPNDMTDDYITYTPNPGFNGVDSFMYQITDIEMVTSTATVNITVIPPSVAGDPPVTIDDNATTSNDTAVTINVLANDFHDGTGVLSIVNQPSNGFAVVNDSGTPNDPNDDTITYTPNTAYFGVDSFIYMITDMGGNTDTATVNIIVAQDDAYTPPIANNDEFTMSEDGVFAMFVLSNDSFGGLGPGSFWIANPPLNGTAFIEVNGTPNNPQDDYVTYTPNPGYSGSDSFTYTISDANGETATATVSITITDIGNNMQPEAGNDNATTQEDVPVTINVLANDTFGMEGPMLVIIATQPENGTALLNNNETPDDPLDDSITYSPNANFNGVDTFTYTIMDTQGVTATATVTITVTPDSSGDSPPFAGDDTVTTTADATIEIVVLFNDTFGDFGPGSTPLTLGSLPENGTAVTNGNGTPNDPTDDYILYTPNTGYFGTDSFTYVITNSEGQSATATVTITIVTEGIMNPVAVNDFIILTEGNSVTINVLTNDDFGSAGPGSFFITNPPINGIVAINDNGTPNDLTDNTITYIPNPGFTGEDLFVYTITDAFGTSASATVNLVVTPNSTGMEPFASDDIAFTDINTAVEIQVLQNDSPGQMGVLTAIAIGGEPMHGTVVINENDGATVMDNTITYTPEAGFSGDDFFTYSISNDFGSAFAIVNVTVTNTGFMLKAFIDTNDNGMQDQDEIAFNQGVFHYEVNNNGTVHDVSSSSGSLYIDENNVVNTYDLSYSINGDLAAYYSVATPAYENVSINTSNITEILFAITAIDFTDVSVQLVPATPPRPGFTYQNVIMYHNNTAQPVSGMVTFNHDDAVTITSVSQAGITNTANGFTYDFTDLGAFETRYINVTMQVPVIPNVTLGQHLDNNAIVTASGDNIADNNTATVTQIVIGSYDPNDITEAHGSKIRYDDFTTDDYLYYTVRFENTGTANAENIHVESILDTQLDVSSIEMLQASGDYTMDRIGNSIVWNFDNIQLPPSEDNSTVGHGYITYKIKPLPGFMVGDEIPASADIYFDFNPAVVTETFYTEFVNNFYEAPIDMQACATINGGVASFDLTSQEDIVFINEVPGANTLKFYLTLADAIDESSNYITDPENYMINTDAIIYLRADSVSNTSFEITAFALDILTGPEMVSADIDETNAVTVNAIGDGELEYKLDDGEFQQSNIFENVEAGLHDIYVRDVNGCSVVMIQIMVDPLGIGENTLNNLSLYPNPVKNNLNINSGEAIQSVIFYNLFGQQVLEEKINAVSTVVDLSSLESGVYLVSVKSAEAVKTIKIVKE